VDWQGRYDDCTEGHEEATGTPASGSRRDTGSVITSSPRKDTHTAVMSRWVKRVLVGGGASLVPCRQEGVAEEWIEHLTGVVGYQCHNLASYMSTGSIAGVGVMTSSISNGSPVTQTQREDRGTG
jgi:hypothetical protein